LSGEAPHRVAGLLLVLACLASCSTATGVQRLEPSSLSCMRAVRDKLPPHIPDKQAHCLAAGGIARYCSRSEAYIAGVGKEFTDLFDGGDAEWGDLVADHIGIECEANATSDEALARCCTTELAKRHLPTSLEEKP
jgi:hypothetical protein